MIFSKKFYKRAKIQCKPSIVLSLLFIPSKKCESLCIFLLDKNLFQHFDSDKIYSLEKKIKWLS